MTDNEKFEKIFKRKIEKMKETYKDAQDYEYEHYKKYNEEGDTVAANRALGNLMRLKQYTHISKHVKSRLITAIINRQAEKNR